MESVICIPFNNEALNYAGKHLVRSGITAAPLPGDDVTHLLLPVPSFDALGKIRGGGSIEGLLRLLPRQICVIGGNLDHPALQGYPTMDLLQAPDYVAQNASITAHCALKYIMNALPITLAHQPILVIGWGRIGKCLARLLRGLDARVSIYARKESDRGMITALGYDAVAPETELSAYRVIINTAPAQVLTEEQLSRCKPDCLKLELASSQGLLGSDVILARGLPGKDAPESSGKLIAQSILRLLNKENVP